MWTIELVTFNKFFGFIGFVCGFIGYVKHCFYFMFGVPAVRHMGS